MKIKILCLFFLLTGYSLIAQDPMGDTIQKVFRNYQTSSPQEKIFIHTDKSFYLTGETIWLKVYVMDAASHRPINISSISYIEVLNTDHKRVLQAKISMRNGFGNGFLIIPGFLSSGNYVIRGYTNWMKNFSSSFFFEQPVTIVNTLKRLTKPRAVRHYATIRFFPEGGNLINGIQAKIAFKATDTNGIGLDCHGLVLDQRNDTVASFHSLHNGMGNFTLKPEKNSTYHALVRLGDSLFSQTLPGTEERGITLNVDAVDPDIFRITVRGTPELNNSDIYLFTQTRQTIKNVQTARLQNGKIVFQLLKKDMPDGISTITVFDSKKQPVCERLIFKRPGVNLSIAASANQEVYDLRSHVDIKVLAKIDSLPQWSNLSASVFLIDTLQEIPKADLISYLYLSSDLVGNIESPDYYFTNPTQATDQALDVLLLTQGWRRFKWDEVLSNKKPFFVFLPELEGPVVSGTVTNKITGVAKSDADAFISVPGADYQFNIATSDEKGVIHFAFKDIYKNTAIVVQPAIRSDSNNRIDLINSWSDSMSSLQMGTISLSKYQQNQLLNRSVDNQIENSFSIEKKRIYPPAIHDSTSFYGRADKVYFLDSYVRYQTMEEVFREYVYDVRIRRDGEKFSFLVKNSPTGLYFERPPLILLDGIPIDDPSIIVGLDPLKIRKIELIAHQYYLGSFVFNGIINVKSYSNEVGATQIDPNAVVVEYEGIQMEREFYSPSYFSDSVKQNRLPDFRNVLYWSPNVLTKADGNATLSFFTSDVPGKYLAFIQGISLEGVPGKSLIQFEVRASK